MKKFKKVLCFILPITIVIALVVGFLPFNKSDRKNTQQDLNEETLFGGDYGNQIVRADSNTGASEVDASRKGGALYLSEGTSYTMSGGIIQGKTNKEYGGAFYVSKNAELIINGGTIRLCQAKYGGAIYVESGGRCYINSGTIINNIAKVAPAIYVENGAELSINFSNVVLKNNFTQGVSPQIISFDKLQVVGNTLSKTQLYEVEFGSYPQTFVGNKLNAELENWYQTIDHDKYDKCYTSGDKHLGHNGYKDIYPFGILRDTSNTWYGYKYIDGNFYVRVQAARPPYYSGNLYQRYKDSSLVLLGREAATNISFAYAWFKVEPIKWYVLNYDEWKAGKGNLELFSELILASNIYYNYNGSMNLSIFDYSNKDAYWGQSNMRLWLNKSFYNEAFSLAEKEMIAITFNYCNYTGFGAGLEDKGIRVADNIYLKSFEELYKSKILSDANSRVAALSDYALANYGFSSPTNTTTYRTKYRVGGCGCYWLRSCSRTAYPTACYVDFDGNIGGMFEDDISSFYYNGLYNKYNFYSPSVINYTFGIRPSLCITGNSNWINR